MSLKLAYLLEILSSALSNFRWAIEILFKGCISSLEYILRVAICIIKTLCFKLKADAINFFFFINLTCLVVKNTFPVV